MFLKSVKHEFLWNFIFVLILRSAKAQCGESSRKFCSVGKQILTILNDSPDVIILG